MSSTYKPRRIWLWLRVLGVVALGLLALPLLSTAAGAHSEYGAPSQPVGTQGAVPQSNGAGVGEAATSDSTTTSDGLSTDSLSTDARSTGGVAGQDTGSAGTTGAGPAFLAPSSSESTSTPPGLAGPNSAGSTVAPESASTSDTSAPAGDNKIVVRKHADTSNGKLIDATFQLWKDVNGNGFLDSGAGSTPGTSTSSTASTDTTSSSAAGSGTSSATLDTKVGSAVSTSGGTHTWTGLAAGTYFVEETVAPSGYQLPSDNDRLVDFSSSSPGQTKTVDFVDVKLSSSPTATETSSTAVSTATSTPGTGAVGLAPPAGSTGGGTLPGVGAPAHLLPVGLAGLASLSGGGWLLSHRRPRGTHAQP